MKKLIFSFIVCLLSVSSFGQIKISHNPKYKKTNFEGIGGLKINNTTIPVIDSLIGKSYAKLETTVYTLGEIPEKMIGSKTLSTVYELQKDTLNIESADIHSKLGKDVRVFYLNYYKAGEIEINNLYFTFFKDTLINIECKVGDNADDLLSVSDAFREKYGDPESILTNKKPIVCQNGYGAVYNYENTTTLFTWLSKKTNIIASEFMSITYNDCQPFAMHTFSISDAKKNKIVEENENRILKRIEDEKHKVKAQKLQDF